MDYFKSYRGCSTQKCDRTNEPNKACMGGAEIFTEQKRIGEHEKFLNELVIIVPKALYRADLYGMRSAERMTWNDFEMKCVRSLVGLSLIDSGEEQRRVLLGSFVCQTTYT